MSFPERFERRSFFVLGRLLQPVWSWQADRKPPPETGIF